MAEDLYGVLGVSKSASDSELKVPIEKARKYHPDVNKEAGAEDQFQKIQKAYDVLSNPQKRAQYDQFGVTDSPGGGSGFGGFGGGAGFEGFQILKIYLTHSLAAAAVDALVSNDQVPVKVKTFVMIWISH